MSTDSAGTNQELVDRTDPTRFGLWRNGQLVGELTYRRLHPNRYTLLHTEVVPEHRGQGVGSALVGAALQEIRERAGTVTAVCSSRTSLTEIRSLPTSSIRGIPAIPAGRLPLPVRRKKAVVTLGASPQHNPEEHNDDLHEFEREIRSQLARAETEEPDLHAGIVAAEPVNGPMHLGYEEVTFEETERYEAGLRALIGAIESVEMDWTEIQGRHRPADPSFGDQ